MGAVLGLLWRILGVWSLAHMGVPRNYKTKDYCIWGIYLGARTCGKYPGMIKLSSMKEDNPNRSLI